MDLLLDRFARLRRQAKRAGTIGFAVLDTPPEQRAAVVSTVLAVLPPGRSREALLIVAYDHPIEIEPCHRDEQVLLIAERERRKAKAEAGRAERARKKADAEVKEAEEAAEQLRFEAWKKSGGR